MRAISLILRVDGIESSYTFLRNSGSDDENANYLLLLDDFEKRYPKIIEFNGTIEENARQLTGYFNEKRIDVLDITGDLQLKRILRRYISEK